MKLTQISDFKIGRSIQGFYLCKEKHLRHTRSGDLFLDLIFSDSTGMMPGKLWDLVDQFQDRFESGDPVAVKGKVIEFNDKIQLTVTQVNQATEMQYGKYGYRYGGYGYGEDGSETNGSDKEDKMKQKNKATKDNK